MENTKIVLVDDHLLFREGLKRILQMEDNMEIIGEAGTGREAVKLVEELNPDVVLMDINMPDLNGVDATEQILEVCPDMKIIILSIHDDESYVQRTLRTGARGYLLKEMDSDTLIQAVQAVARGEAFIHPRVTGRLIEEYRRLCDKEEITQIYDSVPTMKDPEKYALLTPREREVLQLMAEGKSNRMIGEQAYISEKTVKNHVSSILQKLDVLDRTHAVVKAIKNGWVRLDKEIDR
ncbi:response regulator [Rubeoparvulum massiliense]|uniref:response regulator n=1 Tax=Rubeoparvulum massiliense TaxID=1631346 RepID=UPI00065E3E10|nr:response regulator transcription factor [Rubeoparvulum massiliense]